MPPSNERRQSRDTRSWTRSPKLDRRSTLQPRDSLGHDDVGNGPFGNGRLRRRLVTRQGGGGFRGDNDDNDGDSDGEDFNKLGDEPEGPSDDESGVDSGVDSDADDSEDDENVSQTAVTPTSARTSGSIITLTALPPSQATRQSESISGAPQSASASTSVPVQLPSTPTPTKPVLSFQPAPELKEEGEDDTIFSSVTTGIQLTATSASPQLSTKTTSAIGDMPSKEFSMGDDDDGGKHKWRGDGDEDRPPRGLDPTAEHLLIAAGAIGAFILFCFLAWIVFRIFKKSRGQGFSNSGGIAIIDKFPWKRKDSMGGAWSGGTLYMANEAPPMYEKGEHGTMQTFHGPSKTYPPGPGSIVRSAASNSETGTLQQPLNNNSGLAGVVDQYPPDYQVATNNSGINLATRSQIPSSYYDQPGLARQPPEAYIPVRRQTNRASELSSISSGFGDGDIIIPQLLTTPKPAPVATADNPDRLDNIDNPTPRDSWMSRDGGRRESRGEGRRETVYTTTSEDRPARFRSIGSWVNQQAGRVKRAGSRARERGEVPVMPAIPGEISMTRSTTYRGQLDHAT
ncbi:hypothetical protein AAE478_003680 [Parahypoxylon ruwenzoriense]